MQLEIPLSFDIPDWFDRLNTIWFTAALIRLKFQPRCHVPLISSISFAAIAESPHEPKLWLTETLPPMIAPKEPVQNTMDTKWLSDVWTPAGRLMQSREDFNEAFQTFDGVHWTARRAHALVHLWAGLERFFCSGRNRKRAQLADRISMFLGNEEGDVARIRSRVNELYDARSVAAHEGREPDGAFEGSYELYRQVLLKVVENGSLPRSV